MISTRNPRLSSTLLAELLAKLILRDRTLAFLSFAILCTLPNTHTHTLTHSQTFSGTSSRAGAPDRLPGVSAAAFPAGQGYWQSRLARPRRWPKTGPPASLHWLPRKQTSDKRHTRRREEKEEASTEDVAQVKGGEEKRHQLRRGQTAAL